MVGQEPAGTYFPATWELKYLGLGRLHIRPPKIVVGGSGVYNCFQMRVACLPSRLKGRLFVLFILESTLHALRAQGAVNIIFKSSGFWPPLMAELAEIPQTVSLVISSTPTHYREAAWPF